MLQIQVQLEAGGWLVSCLAQASGSWTQISADSPSPAGGTGSGVWTRGGPLPRPALSGLLQGALGPCWARVRLTAGGAAALAPQILAGKGKSGQWGQGQGSWNLDLQAQLEALHAPCHLEKNWTHFLTPSSCSRQSSTR